MPQYPNPELTPVASDTADVGVGASNAPDAHRHDLFLSYHTPDRAAVRTVQKLLEARGLKVFLDRDQLSAGLPWPQALEEALRSARAVAVFLGHHDMGLWQKRETWFALDRQVQEERAGRRFPVVPVLLDGPDPATGLLFLNTWVDLRRDLTDPEALDALSGAVRGDAPVESTDRRADLCPYRGLQLFHEDEAAFFSGREAVAEQLRQTVTSSDFVGVVGTSGSGKSSVVQAGLLPLLRRIRPPADTWDAIVFTPDSLPFHRLAAELVPFLEPDLGATDRLAVAQRLGDQLARGDVHLEAVVRQVLKQSAGTDRLLLVADQFEELFTLTPESSRKPFVDALLGACGHAALTVLVTLRADFYGHAIRMSRELSDRLGRAVVNLGPMRREELQRAILEPARRVGLSFELGLIDTILDDVGEQPGALPLLEHALLELWNRRRGRVLTLEAYRASGGVGGALAQRADETYRRLDPEQQAIARRILLRLTQPGEGTEDTRRRATFDELVTGAGQDAMVDTVVRALADNRLLTTGREEQDAERWVNVSHEALIRGWPELRKWLDEDREGLRVLRRVTDAAQEWERLGRDEDVLYRGARLAGAVEWRARDETSLNDVERAFLDASAALQAREQSAEEARQQRDLEAAQRLASTEKERAEVAQALARTEKTARLRQRYLSVGLAGLLLGALFVSVVAILARNEAINQQAIAASRELAASAMGRLSFDPELSLLLALEAASQAPTAEAGDSLRKSVLASQVRISLRGHAGAVHSAVFSPDGGRVVTAGADKTARIWDASTGRQIAVLQGHAGEVVRAGFSADGGRVLTASLDNTGRIWDAQTGRPIATLQGHTGWVRRAVFSPDGTRVVSASSDETARVWDASTGHEVFVLSGHTQWLSSAVFSPDGTRVVTSSDDGTARLWDMRTGQLLQELRGHAAAVRSAVFSPDGRRVATASADGTARIWNVDTGGQTVELRGHTDGLDTAVFSPDGGRVLTASADGTARVWDAQSGQATTVLRGNAGALRSAVFSPDGAHVVTASSDGTARLWDAASGQELLVLRGHAGAVSLAVFSPDGARVLTSGADGTARIWDAGLKQDVVLTGHSGPVKVAVFSPDGARILTAGDDRTARVWDTATGQPVAELRGHASSVHSAAFSPDGTRVVTASADAPGPVRVWDPDTGRQLAELQGYNGWVSTAVFSPDGERVLAAGGDGMARIWDAGTGRDLALFESGPAWLTDAEFSQDGKRVVTASRDGIARVWDADGKQPPHVLSGHTDGLDSAIFSPDGATLLTASTDGTARVWDALTGRATVVLGGPPGGLQSAAFSSDGTRIVTANSDGTVRVWNAASGRELVVLRGHAGLVVRAVFSADGARVLSAGNDRTARVWDALTGQPLGELHGHESGLTTVAFSPDGTRVLSASSDGRVLVQTCETCRSLKDLMLWAPGRLTRQLTAEERRQYLHEPDQ